MICLYQPSFHLNHHSSVTLASLWYMNYRACYRRDVHFHCRKWMLSSCCMLKVLFGNNRLHYTPLVPFNWRFSERPMICPVTSELNVHPICFTVVYSYARGKACISNSKFFYSEWGGTSGWALNVHTLTSVAACVQENINQQFNFTLWCIFLLVILFHCTCM